MKTKFWSDFKTFAMRGNVVDMAVGIIIGGAFGKIVSSIVNDILMPTIGLLLGGIEFSSLKAVVRHAVMEGETVVRPEVAINYGNFIQVTVDFLIIAFCVYLIVKTMARLSRKKEEAPAAPAAPAAPTEVELLGQIRDILSEKK